jgi:hypothetical protein
MSGMKQNLRKKDFTCYTFTMAGFAGVKPQPNASFKLGNRDCQLYKTYKIENQL